MRGRDDFAAFVAARTQDLHHDAYLLTADQGTAERLVTLVLAELSRTRDDLTQSASASRIRMACAAARMGSPSVDDAADVPTRFRSLAALSPRQRAILLLHVADDYDLHSAAQPLRLKRREVEQAYAGIPPGLTDTDPDELRSLLDDFGDLAETPSAATTLTAIRQIQRLRRPWWTYAASTVVVAFTVSALGVTHSWHEDWLRTAAGLNHAHGTHFPAYADGYKLIGIQDVPTGGRQELNLAERSALAFPCPDGQPDESTVGRVVTGDDGNYPAQCGSAGHAQLMPTSGDTLVTIADTDRRRSPVGVYRKIPWAEYPVATSGFSVQTGETLDIDVQADPYALPTERSKRGPVLILRGTSGHFNGTFTGSVTVPAGSRDTWVAAGGLLSPSTTGRFRLDIGGKPWSLNCDLQGRPTYDLAQDDPWCEIYDRHVPQVSFTGTIYRAIGKTMTVSITVQHALGPWTLQVAAERYKPEFGD